MTIATSAEQIAVCAALADWARARDTTGLVRAELDAPSDGWRNLWPELAELGIFAATADEERGGLGAPFADAAAMVAECGRWLVPGPIVATMAAGVALSRTDGERARELTEAVLAGELPVVVPADHYGYGRDPLPVNPAGRIDLGLVPGWVPEAALLVNLVFPQRGTRWYLVPPGGATVDAQRCDALDGTMSCSRVAISGLDLDVAVELPRASRVSAVLGAGFTAFHSGVARWCLDTAADYAKVRTQFGAPIGSFQAIKHLLADMLCRSEQLSAAAWDQAGAVDDLLVAPEDDFEAGAQHGLAAMAANILVAELPLANAKDCVQVLGGIGFTFEHDAHLYLRSALAMRAALADSSAQRVQLGRAAVAGERRRFSVDLTAVEEQRAGVRATVEQIAATPVDERRGELARTGYLAPHWPKPQGLGASPALQLLIDDELDRAGVERPDLVIAGWAIPTILEHGTDEQRERFVAPTLAGDIIWCQLFSEPEAGSDLASLRTKAVRGTGPDGEPGWRLTGQKIWTSQAHNAQWAVCLARTDADAPKHKGITYFLVDMASAGIDIRPLRELTGRAMFNEVFLDDVFVPDELVVGEVNGGWRLARTTLANERVAMGGSSLGKEMDALLRQIEAKKTPLSDGELAELGSLVAEAHNGRALDARSVSQRLAGHDPGAASSVRKLIGVIHRQAVPDFALRLLGVDGMTDSEASELFLLNRCLSIAGGTTQILKTAAAERILGMPRG
ncbi:acyl-CoA dehydrogenase [Gordonia sp. X0973]|uniref:acyl-CoA dehydrogenase n=1 Tax=Gordonia sp. X0973 TaxID=2742602 RepID=UPI0013EB7E45|nr:acyl-CoA dehydrogenase [Gordonia sp. X0973]QKT06247.1 acyl-CoA dehydrogenase [Gordonia sp. X0973]